MVTLERYLIDTCKLKTVESAIEESKKENKTFIEIIYNRFQDEVNKDKFSKMLSNFYIQNKKDLILDEDFSINDVYVEIIKRYSIKEMLDDFLIPVKIDNEILYIISPFEGTDIKKAYTLKKKYIFKEVDIRLVSISRFKQIIRDYELNFSKHLPSVIDNPDIFTKINDGNVIIKYIGNLIQEYGLSDIHIDPKLDKSYEIKGRYMGNITTFAYLDTRTGEQTINKLVSEARVSEIPEIATGGMCTITLENDLKLNCRIHKVPSKVWDGIMPKATLRVLGSNKDIIPISTYGYLLEDLDIIKNKLKSEGLILIGGPTGSGKTTAVYSLLEYMSSGSNNIMSIEDPVEIQVPFMNQIEISETKDTEGKLTSNLDSIVKEIVRHDFDALFTGEVRDNKTAELALAAANMGRTVLSTIHLASSLDFLSRFSDFKVSLNKVIDYTKIIVVQKLVRVVCPECGIEISDKKELEKLKYVFGDEYTFHKKGLGCQHCKKGYIARTPMYEMLIVDKDLKLELKKSLVEVVDLTKYVYRTKEESILNRLNIIDVEDLTSIFTSSDAELKEMKERIEKFKTNTIKEG